MNNLDQVIQRIDHKIGHSKIIQEIYILETASMHRYSAHLYNRFFKLKRDTHLVNKVQVVGL